MYFNRFFYSVVFALLTLSFSAYSMESSEAPVSSKDTPSNNTQKSQRYIPSLKDLAALALPKNYTERQQLPDDLKIIAQNGSMLGQLFKENSLSANMFVKEHSNIIMMPVDLQICRSIKVFEETYKDQLAEIRRQIARKGILGVLLDMKQTGSNISKDK